MSEDRLGLTNAPIIEAIFDIHCDLPPVADISELQGRAERALSPSYPRVHRAVVQRHEFRAEAEKRPQVAVRKFVGALQFRSEDEKQIVQLRPEGFSFNRLAPYSSLDEYLPEVERTWLIFRDVAQPIQVRRIGLRFINRLLLPLVERRLALGTYLRVNPHVGDDSLEIVGFANQHAAIELETGNGVNIAVVMQPLEEDRLPVILDIDTFDQRVRSPDDWEAIREALLSLRNLKNRVFKGALTEECLNLYRQP